MPIAGMRVTVAMTVRVPMGVVRGMAVTMMLTWNKEIVHNNNVIMETRGFSKDQLKGKQLSLMFQPNALVVFRAKVKLGAKNCTT